MQHVRDAALAVAQRARRHGQGVVELGDLHHPGHEDQNSTRLLFGGERGRVTGAAPPCVWRGLGGKGLELGCRVWGVGCRV